MFRINSVEGGLDWSCSCADMLYNIYPLEVKGSDIPGTNRGACSQVDQRRLEWNADDM